VSPSGGRAVPCECDGEVFGANKLYAINIAAKIHIICAMDQDRAVLFANILKSVTGYFGENVS
jgi:hypothetical protein